MFKVILAAIGIVAASAQYEYTWAPFEDNHNNYFNFEMDVVADAYYTTTYQSADSDENYGFEIASYIDMSFLFEYFEWYQHEYTVHIVPFKFVPYNQ